MLGFALLPPRDSDDDMPDNLRDELLRNLDTFHNEMLRGFQGINERLDKQNGRVGALERRESAHHERLHMLEQTVAESPQDQRLSKKQMAVTFSLGAGGYAAMAEVIKALLRMRG